MINWLSENWIALTIGSTVSWFVGFHTGYRVRGVTLYIEENNVKGLSNKAKVGTVRLYREWRSISFTNWVNLFLCIALIFVGWLAFDARDQLAEVVDDQGEQAECTRDYLMKDRIARDARTEALVPRDAAVNRFQKEVGTLISEVPDLVAGGDFQGFLAQVSEANAASNELDRAQRALDTERQNNEYPPFPERYCDSE